jgi:anti-sigma regulatory factor (Ser/Thr protein kinase)
MGHEALRTETIAGEHLVHFYASVADLSERVGPFLADALRGGGTAVAIVTPEHRAAFDRELAAAGLDPAGAAAGGRLLWLDAATTVGSLLVDGRIDAVAFEREIGTLMRATTARSRGPVRAYGEMVALLWQAGDVSGAIELERAWNGLMHDVPFSLLCGYASAAVAAPELDAALAEVCRLHAAVTPAREISGRFSRADDAPRAARRFLQTALREWGHEGRVLDDARLVISELATNAVRHARSPFEVTIRAEAARVRIAVADDSQAVPAPGHPDVEAVSGRGLHLIGLLAHDWGVDHTPTGKVVWVELAVG